MESMKAEDSAEAPVRAGVSLKAGSSGVEALMVGGSGVDAVAAEGSGVAAML